MNKQSFEAFGRTLIYISVLWFGVNQKTENTLFKLENLVFKCLCVCV